MFSVFLQPVFLFSDSRNINYFGPKAHGPENRAEGWDWSPRAEAGPGQVRREPPPPPPAPSQQLRSVGLAPAPLLASTAWCRDSSTGFCR